MFCTKCGVEITQTAKYCQECGSATTNAPSGFTVPGMRLSRPTSEGKIAGVCAGVARYFDADVTLVRLLWVILSLWPVPLLGAIAYIAAWIVMPKDPLALPAPVNSVVGSRV